MAKSNNKKKGYIDLFGNPVKEPAGDLIRHISPKMKKYREYITHFTVQELHEIRKCLGFEFKTGNKDAFISATLGFFSSLEEKKLFRKWFESLPPYLSRAIEEASFKGYIDARVVEKAAGKPVSVENRSYYYHNNKTNPDLRLGIFDLYVNNDLRLLFMRPLFRELFNSRLPAPPNYSLGPCGEQELTGWSAAESISESMPLLLKSIDHLLDDQSTHEKILRRGLNKKDIKELRKSSAFPHFPRGAAFGIDPIDLIARFIMIDPEHSFTSQKKDVRDFLKEVVKTFFTIPPSGKIRSYYIMINSSFEFSVLCPHLSKGQGPRWHRSLFHPHPPARSFFYQVITNMAKTGSWYNMDEVAESLQMQAIPFTIFSNDYNSSEIILKGEELRLPEGTITIDRWEKGFVPDIYLKHTILTRPLLKGYCYLMAAMGLLEIEEVEPEKLLKKKGKLTPISPYDGLIRARTTPFGAWCLGLSKEKPELRRVSYEAIADRELPLVTYRGHSLECKVFLDRIGVPIGEDRFRVTEASFIRDCSSVEDIEHRVSEFQRLIAQDPAPHWGELFSRVKERSRLFDREELCVMIQLPEDRELRRLFLEDKKFSSLVVRAEGGRIVVKQQNYKKLRKALEGYGVLKG